MARERVFKVVIDGEEYVSKAADDAGKGMDRFTGKKDGWIRSFVDLRAAFDTVVQVGRALAGVAMESLAAFDEYSASMRRLEGTARITGTPLEHLSDLAEHAKRQFGLSSVQANEYATSVNNLATKAGYAGDKQELLAAMLDLGAAKGLTAAESLLAFQQSILGIDEGTDKLFGKNPSGLWADFAEQIGKSPGKMSDLEKSLVLVYATMEAGGKVQGSYSEWLQSSAGQTALLSNRLNDMRVKFGEVLSPIRAVVVEGMNQFLDSLSGGEQALAQVKAALTGVTQNLIGAFLSAWKTTGPAVVFALKAMVAGVMFTSDAIRSLGIFTQEAVGQVVKWFGILVQQGGKMLRIFGIEMVEGWGTTMRSWGEATETEASRAWTRFRTESQQAWDRVTGDAVEATPVVNRQLASIGETATTMGQQVGTGTAAAGDAIKRHLGPATKDLIVLTEDAMRSLKVTATETLEPKKADDFAGAVDILTRKLHEAKAAVGDTTPKLEANTDRARDMGREVGTIARGALDLAQSFGVVDAQAASVLNSVVNIAQALPRALAGDFTSIGGIVAGVANIAQQITQGDAERRRLLNANTQALQRLSRDVGGLNLNVTGETFSRALSALSAAVPQFDLGTGGSPAEQMRRRTRNATALTDALESAGLSIAQFEEVAKTLGLSIRNGSGGLDFAAIGQVLQGLQGMQLGRLPQDFASQLEFFRQTQDITGTAGTASGLQGLLDFLVNAGGVSALQGFDLAAPDARQRLFELFTSLNNGGVAASALGRLTGSEFRDLLIELIGGIDGLSPTTPPAASPPPTVAGGETVPVGGAPTPATTLAEVFATYADQSVPLLQSQLDTQAAILAASERTAENTAATVDVLVRLLGAVTDGTLVNGVDAALADRVREMQTLRGEVAG